MYNDNDNANFTQFKINSIPKVFKIFNSWYTILCKNLT